ncbi:hypothetical protein SKAU_G00368190 [Synaphobranchus kaupii]|uniref:Uncharacterized protein n=1 Tax=Synaphobranchus kaupii TaxID=118154 RepID=A0A9Q1EFH3_SYNKA|nr:hypothetical protein SKAU_G00368190 [Synaphobranchus kaupii]
MRCDRHDRRQEAGSTPPPAQRHWPMGRAHVTNASYSEAEQVSRVSPVSYGGVGGGGSYRRTGPGGPSACHYPLTRPDPNRTQVLFFTKAKYILLSQATGCGVSVPSFLCGNANPGAPPPRVRLSRLTGAETDQPRSHATEEAGVAPFSSEIGVWATWPRSDSVSDEADGKRVLVSDQLVTLLS